MLPGGRHVARGPGLRLGAADVLQESPPAASGSIGTAGDHFEQVEVRGPKEERKAVGPSGKCVVEHEQVLNVVLLKSGNSNPSFLSGPEY